MTGAFGTAGEISDGRYTGELASPALHGERKVGVIKEISASRNYDLERSFAYSDSISDLPMLVSVGSPAIVNANKSLETIAKKNRWLIIK
jgi:phosphoserine phosphatase